MNRVWHVVEHPHPRVAREAAAALAASGAAGGAQGSASSSSPPVPMTDLVQGAADQLWDEQSDRAFGLLVLCLGTPQLTSLARQVAFGDVHGVWKLITNRYERKTVVSKTAAIKQVFAARMESNEHVDLFVARLKSLVSVLDEMGEHISEGMQKHILLTGLSPTFSAFVQSLGLHQGLLTFDEIVMHLVDHQEAMLVDARDAAALSRSRSARDEIATYAQVSMNQPRGNEPRWQQQMGRRNGQSRGGSASGVHGQQQQQQPRKPFATSNHGRPARKCFGCGSEDHMAFDCPQNRDAVKCFACRRLGHRDNQCPNPRRNGGGAPHDRPSNGSHGHHHQQSAMAAVQDEYESKYDSDRDDGAVFVADADDAVCAAAIVQPRLGAGDGLTSSRSDVTEWVLDSGATRHLVHDRTMLTSLQTLSDPIRLRVADGTMLQLRQVGGCKIRTTVGLESRCVTLQGVACDERLWCNLISVPRIVKAGYRVSFEENEAIVSNKLTGRIVLTVPKRGQLYVLQIPRVLPIGSRSCAARMEKEHIDAVFTVPQVARVVAVNQPRPVAAIPVSVAMVPQSASTQWHGYPVMAQAVTAPTVATTIVHRNPASSVQNVSASHLSDNSPVESA